MFEYYNIPLTPEPQRLGITLAGREYRLRVYWNGAGEGGWMLDIALAENEEQLLLGLPLVSGGDLLEQFAYLGLGGGLWVDSELPPGLDNLGADSRLLFVTESLRAGKARTAGSGAARSERGSPARSDSVTKSNQPERNLRDAP